MRKRVGRMLRNLAYRIDPPAKPGRKRTRVPKVEPDSLPMEIAVAWIEAEASLFDGANAAEAEGL